MKAIGAFVVLILIGLSDCEKSRKNKSSKGVFKADNEDSRRNDFNHGRILSTRFLSDLHFANGDPANLVLLHVDMTEEMQHEVVQYAIAAMDSHTNNLAEYICSRMRSNHSGDWHCFYGDQEFGYSIRNTDRYYFDFKLKTTFILVFR